MPRDDEAAMGALNTAVSWRVASAALFLLAATSACRNEDRHKTADKSPTATRTASAGGATTPQPSEPTLRLSINGEVRAFSFGKAIIGSGGVRIVLATEQIPCSGRAEPSNYVVNIDLPPGPKGAFFTGHAIGIGAVVSHEHAAEGIPPFQCEANVEPFALDAGGRVRGAVKISASKVRGDGSFDVELCHGEEAPLAGLALPDSTSDTPVTGMWGGLPFAPKSSFATVAYDGDQRVRYISALDFYAEPGMDCPDEADQPRTNVFRVYYFGGTAAGSQLLGRAQPARAGFFARNEWHVFGDSKTFQTQGVWVKLDVIDHEAHRTVRGRLFATTPPDAEQQDRGTFAGTFEAKVCVRPIPSPP